jgi:surface antigen
MTIFARTGNENPGGSQAPTVTGASPAEDARRGQSGLVRRGVSMLARTATVAALAGGAVLLAAGIPQCSSPTYLTTASPSLNVRSGPSTADTVVGSLAYHTSITISCQTTGATVDGSAIWDEIGSGRYVSDYWVNTPNFGTYSPGLAVCAGTPTGGGGTIGRTVGDNPFPGGQCTWGADNLAHEFMATDPTAYPSGHSFIEVSGNADQWASSASANGWTVVSTPHLDSIVVFQPGVQGADPTYGHVAFVTAVYSNGTFQIEEMNATAGSNYDFRTVSEASGESFILIPPFS